MFASVIKIMSQNVRPCKTQGYYCNNIQVFRYYLGMALGSGTISARTADHGSLDHKYSRCFCLFFPLSFKCIHILLHLPVMLIMTTSLKPFTNVGMKIKHGLFCIFKGNPTAKTRGISSFVYVRLL